MTCPYCNHKLTYNSYLYKGNHSAYEKGYENSGFKVVGHSWKCENVDGFESLEETIQYMEENNLNMSLEDVVCESANFNGHFWSDNNDNLHEGLGA